MAIIACSVMQSLVLPLGLDDLADFGELDELVDGLKGDAGVVLDLVVVDHFVHVVGGDGADDVLALLVEPDLCVLVEGALVELVEQREGAGLVVLLLLLAGRHLLAVLGLADQQDLLLLGLRLLLAVGLRLDVEVVGVMQVWGEVLGLLRVLGEESLDLDDGREELEVLARARLETRQQLGVSNRCHLSTLDKYSRSRKITTCPPTKAPPKLPQCSTSNKSERWRIEKAPFFQSSFPYQCLKITVVILILLRMWGEAPKFYSAVMCQTCWSMKKHRCYKCSNPAIHKQAYSAKICPGCTSSKRLQCTKCRKGINGQYMSGYYCEGCQFKSEDLCAKCGSKLNLKQTEQ